MSSGNVTTRNGKEFHGDQCCIWCEYFDGGGQAKVLSALCNGIEINGDCHNRESPRFQTTSNGTCEKFCS